MLTPKQRDLLMFIHRRIHDTGVSPSFDEMKDALELKSKSGVHRLITALEERGFIRRLPHRARALEVLKVPEALGNLDNDSSGKFQPSLVAGPPSARAGASGKTRGRTAAKNQTVSIPVMGRIAAGVPISAIQDHSHDLEVPPDMVTRGAHFALEVRGDSMIEAGINDGDLVIIRKSETADNGDIVVALVDNEEATLKRLRKRGNSVALEAANPAFETRIFGPDRVDIQGRLVGLIRRY